MSQSSRRTNTKHVNIELNFMAADVSNANVVTRTVLSDGKEGLDLLKDPNIFLADSGATNMR